MTSDDHEPGTPERGRKRGRWIAAVVVLLALIVAGGVLAAVISDDGDGDVAGQVRSAADDGVDAVTSAGDEALDTATSEAPGAADAGVDAVTNAGDEALDTVTSQGDDAIDGVTGGGADDSTTVPQAVQDDPVVKSLAKGRELPFTAGPWTRQAYRDRVFDRLSDATRERAEKVDVGDGFGIRIR